MTEEELKKVKFHEVAHLALETEYSTTYASKDGRLGICDHVPRKKNGKLGCGYLHWRIYDKIYKTKEKFLKELKDYTPNK